MRIDAPGVTLVVIDLVPALLARDGSSLEIAPDGRDAVAHLYSHYRLIGLTDADVTSSSTRRALVDANVAGFFDSISTSAPFGPTVNPRVIRRITSSIRAKTNTVFVTGREQLVQAMSRSRFGVVLTSRHEFGAVPEAVATLVSGRVTP